MLIKEFKSEIVKEYSASPIPESLGMASNKMTLRIADDKATGDILWEIEYDNDEDEGDEVGIGLWFEGNRVTDYDGVFELPTQAAELLRENGYNTDDVE